MPREKKSPTKTNGNGANLGFEATLWAAADKMRNNMDACGPQELRPELKSQNRNVA